MQAAGSSAALILAAVSISPTPVDPRLPRRRGFSCASNGWATPEPSYCSLAPGVSPSLRRGRPDSSHPGPISAPDDGGAGHRPAGISHARHRPAPRSPGTSLPARGPADAAVHISPGGPGRRPPPPAGGPGPRLRQGGGQGRNRSGSGALFPNPGRPAHHRPGQPAFHGGLPRLARKNSKASRRRGATGPGGLFEKPVMP